MEKYNENKIQAVVNDFKNRNLTPRDITIYFDMDNVLCLFSVFGDEDTALKKMYHKNYFKELPCFQEAPAVIENLQKIGFKVKILSSCIDSPYCKPEKRLWLHYHLPTIKDEDIILISVGENKSNYIENIETSILVEDYCQNIINFYDVGGVAIKKSYSGKQRPVPQIESLVDLFNILYQLGCLK